MRTSATLTPEKAQEQVKTRRKRRDATDDQTKALKRLRLMRRRINIQGLTRMDERTSGAKQLIEWRAELTAALGGADVSPQRATLIELAARAKLLLDHCDAFILTLPTFIIRRKKSVMPIVRERQAIAEHLAKLLERLGLDKQMKRVEDLDAWIERKAREKEEASSEEAQPDPAA